MRLVKRAAFASSSKNIFNIKEASIGVPQQLTFINGSNPNRLPKINIIPETDELTLTKNQSDPANFGRHANSVSRENSSPSLGTEERKKELVFGSLNHMRTKRFMSLGWEKDEENPTDNGIVKVDTNLSKIKEEEEDSMIQYRAGRTNEEGSSAKRGKSHR